MQQIIFCYRRLLQLLFASPKVDSCITGTLFLTSHSAFLDLNQTPKKLIVD
jgi:hypothetical protein